MLVVHLHSWVKTKNYAWHTSDHRIINCLCPWLHCAPTQSSILNIISILIFNSHPQSIYWMSFGSLEETTDPINHITFIIYLIVISSNTVKTAIMSSWSKISFKIHKCIAEFICKSLSPQKYCSMRTKIFLSKSIFNLQYHCYDNIFHVSSDIREECWPANSGKIKGELAVMIRLHTLTMWQFWLCNIV